LATSTPPSWPSCRASAVLSCIAGIVAGDMDAGSLLRPFVVAAG
jgi:hypothetical protein